MSQLLITLSSGAPVGAELAYALVSSAGVLTSHGFAAPALLPKADQATLVLPAQALSWHAAVLPKLPRGSSLQKQQALLAGVLEEQLLDDAAQLHLVACPTLASAADESGRTWIVACDKAWLTEHVRSLQAAHIPLTRIVPQAFPTQAVQVHASGSPELAWLTSADAQGVVVVPLQQAGVWTQRWPQELKPSAEPAVAALAEAVLGQRVDVVQAPQRALQAEQAALAQGLDLATGDLAVSGGGRTWRRMMNVLRELAAAPAWRPVRYGLVLLLLANVLGLNAWAWKEHRALQDKRAQMGQLLTQSFPHVKVVVDAPLQMQRELASLRQAQGQLSGRDFESIFSRFSALALTNTAPNAIEFIANEVQIKGAGLSAEQLNDLQPRLQYVGLGVRSDAQALIVSHRDTLSASPAPAVLSSGAKP
jgi:general secretion pathway protein L